MPLDPQSRIILVQNRETDPQDKLRQHIEGFFKAAGVSLETVVLESRNCPVVRPENLNPDLILVLGGDGTFLRAVRCFAKDSAPVVGINTGHLGFLTQVEANKVDDCLNALMAGKTTLEYRMMLAVQSEELLALNDVVVKNANPSRLATINVFVNGTYLATYDADGVIVATPTGSTAYNLSAGGPIMVPQADVLAITPICPHSLSAKPIILPSNQELVLESDESNTSDLVCAVDGDDAFTLKPGEQFKIFKSRHQLPLISLQQDTGSFYALLKRKLGWGANPRAVAKSKQTV
jgi:NAD+ kinase